MAGGRYYNIMKEMGGPDLAGIGWAAGIERLMLLIQPLIHDNKLVSVIPIDSKYNNIAFKFKMIYGAAIFSLPVFYYAFRSIHKKLSFRRNRINE